MRGLSLIVTKQEINSDSSKKFYSHIQKNSFDHLAINTIFEQLLFALHQCSALHALTKVPCKSDIVRVGIVSWYYGIYAAASAMVAAQDGSFQNDHTTTAKSWDRQIAANNLIVHPFNLRITTLIEKDSKAQLKKLTSDAKIKCKSSLIGKPLQSLDEAYSACHAYLSGTVNWSRWNANEALKSSKDFKELGVSNFRTKKAISFRDKHLEKKKVGFLHQALRYRGKANYRDSIFIGYGKNTEKALNTYPDDLSCVLDAFVCQAGIFCSRRLGEELWNTFLTDLAKNRSFSLCPHIIWGNL